MSLIRPLNEELPAWLEVSDQWLVVSSYFELPLDVSGEQAKTLWIRAGRHSGEICGYEIVRFAQQLKRTVLVHLAPAIP